MKINKETILLLTTGLLILLLLTFKYQDNDLWMHLRTGQLIIEQHAPPTVDGFTFSTANAEWIAHEWLSAVIFYLVYSAGGIVGLGILGIILTAAILGLYWLFLVERHQDDRTLVACWILFAVILGRDKFFLRPHLFSFLAQAISLTILYTYRQKQDTRLWWLIPLEVFWANLHGATAFLGVVLPVLFGAGWWLETKLQKKAANFKIGHFLAVSALVLAASLLNPYGYKIYEISFGPYSMGIFRQTIKEWAPPSAPPLLLLLGTYLALLGWLIGRAIYKRREAFSELFLTLIYSYLACSSVRFVALLAVVTIPGSIILLRQEEVVKRIFSTYPRKIILLVFLSALAIFDLSNQEKYLFGLGLDARKTPVAAAEYLLSQPTLPANIFNSFNLGGYLIWRAYPRYRVFIDGRQIGSVPVFLENLSFFTAGQRWQTVVSKYNLELVVIDYPQFQQALNIAAQRLQKALPAEQWALIYFDDVAMVFLKRTAKYNDFIAQNEFRLIKPYAPDYQYLEELARDKNLTRPLEGELAHALRLTPLGFNANYFAGIYLLQNESYAAAVKHFLIAERQNPAHEPNLNNLALAYLYNNEEAKAIEVFHSLLKINPHDAISWSNLGKIYLNKNEASEAIKCLLKAVKYDNLLLEAHYSLALAYEGANQKSQARSAWETYIDLAQNQPGEAEWLRAARQRLAELKK